MLKHWRDTREPPVLNDESLEMLILIPVEERSSSYRGQPIQAPQHKANNLPLVSGLLAGGARHRWNGSSGAS